MTEQNKQNVKSSLLLPLGTQVVTAVEVVNPDGQPLRLSGTVGKIISALEDNSKPYRILFPVVAKQSCIGTEAKFRMRPQLKMH